MPCNHSSLWALCSSALHKLRTSELKWWDKLMAFAQAHSARNGNWSTCVFLKNFSRGTGSSSPLVPLVTLVQHGKNVIPFQSSIGGNMSILIDAHLIFLLREKNCRPEDSGNTLGFWKPASCSSPTEGPTTLFWTPAPALGFVPSYTTFYHSFLEPVFNENCCTIRLFWVEEAAGCRMMGMRINCQLQIPHVEKVLRLITQDAIMIKFCRHNEQKTKETSDQVASYYFST